MVNSELDKKARSAMDEMIQAGLNEKEIDFILNLTEKDKLALKYINEYYTKGLHHDPDSASPRLLKELKEVYKNTFTVIERGYDVEDFYKTKAGQYYMENLYNFNQSTINEKIISSQQKILEETGLPLYTDSPARRADENINRKETNMSDFDENEEVVVTERNYQEEAFKNAINSRIVVSNALKEGTLSCLPNAEGFADTEKVINAITGKVYHGDNLLILKEHQKQNNCPTGEYITFDQLEKMKKDKPDLYIRKGEKGVSIYFSEKIEGSDKYEHKHARLINIAQTSNPKEIKEWIEQKHIEEQKRVEEYYKSQGKNYNPKPQTQNNNPEVIKCTSTEPVKYLGEYLAAVSMGSKFEVTKEQAEEFANNFGNKLWEKTGVSPKDGKPITNPFMLSKITNEASQHCKEVIKNTHIQQNKVNQPKQEQTQSQSRGR